MRPLLTVAVTLVVVLVPLVVVGARQAARAEGRLQQQKLEQAGAAAEEAAVYVGGILTHLEDALVTAAGDPGLVREAEASATAPLAVRLARMRPLLPQEVMRIFVLDPAGHLLAIDPPAPDVIGQSFAHRDYYQGVTRERGPYVSETFVTAVQGTPPAVAIAVPVSGTGGTSAGVLAVALDLERAGKGWFARLLASFDDVYLVDSKGRVVTRASAPGADALRDLSADPSVAAAREGGSVHGFVDDFAGHGQVLVTSEPVAGAGWHVFVVEDPNEIGAALRQILGVLIALSIVLLIIVVAGSFALSATVRAVVARRGALDRVNAELLEASHAKSAFLAGMSHELRTPLNAILGFSSLMRERPDLAPEKRERYLRNINDAGEHLLALINDVLDLSKVESGKVVLRRERISLQAAVEPVLAAARSDAVARGVRLDASLEGVDLDVDAGRLRQILYNLLSNAAKFTSAGGQVALRLWSAGRDLHISVADTGIGIPLERQSRVFGVFERVNEDRSTSSGSGLGLALTKSLVELQGGTISFTSSEGAGTTFVAILPGVVQAAVAGERVLVVEDDPRAADLAVAIASHAGLSAEIATSVDAALAAARRTPPLAVLLDLQLTDERGEAVLRQLRACDTTRTIPIAIVSIEDNDDGGRSIGADAYFVKPVDGARLTEWLASVTAPTTAAA